MGSELLMKVTVPTQKWPPVSEDWVMILCLSRLCHPMDQRDLVDLDEEAGTDAEPNLRLRVL